MALNLTYCRRFYDEKAAHFTHFLQTLLQWKLENRKIAGSTRLMSCVAGVKGRGNRGAAVIDPFPVKAYN